MRNHSPLIRGIFIVFLCLMVVLSILDTHETRYDTDFDQDAILAHIENLTAHGPRSIADPDANQQAIAYITKTLESWGIVNYDTTDAPAYQIQSFVATDDDYQNWYLENVIVHIPANAAEASGQAQMFMGHFDSVPMGPGASDDGVAVSAMLEAIRYYLSEMEQGFTMENDLVFCFVNGEEYALYGSAAFMREFTGFDNVVERSTGEILTNTTYWITKTNDLLPAAYYTFGEDGKMIDPPATEEPDPEEPVEPETKNGIVSEDGKLWWYVDGVKTYGGLMLIDGDYYYARSTGEIITNITYWITKTNDLLPAGFYTFGADGKMVTE